MVRLLVPPLGSHEDERFSEIVAKQIEKDKRGSLALTNHAGSSQRDKEAIKGQINILDPNKKHKYLHKLEQKEKMYWENKKNEKLRLKRFR